MVQGLTTVVTRASENVDIQPEMILRHISYCTELYPFLIVVKACPHSATVAVVSTFSATVALFCDSVDRASAADVKLRTRKLIGLIHTTYVHAEDFFHIFLPDQHIYAIARYMLSPVRPSVRPSVCPSHGWISQRRLKLGSCNLHRRVSSSFLTLNFTAKFQREHRERGRRIREGYEKYAIFSQ